MTPLSLAEATMLSASEKCFSDKNNGMIFDVDDNITQTAIGF